MTARIALVGHCGPDSFALQAAISSAVEGALIERVNDETGLRTALDTADLLLVNRVLDGAFASESGIELIRTIVAAEGAPPAMLISNYADAQAEAEAAGAKPGFGKADMRSGAARDAVLHALGRE